MSCHACGAALSDGQRFCTSCGSPVAAAQSTQAADVSESVFACASCGADRSASDRFCTRCGAVGAETLLPGRSSVEEVASTAVQRPEPMVHRLPRSEGASRQEMYVPRGSRKRERGSALAIGVAAAVLVALGLGAGGWYLKARKTEVPSAQLVVLEGAEVVAADPFTRSVASGVRLGQAARDVGGQVTGDTPGLYGGSRDEQACDKGKLVDYLTRTPAKSKAWAGALHIKPGDIKTYVERLTPVLLTHDTRVTNHGFAAGQAVAFQSVLQAGTAVLVDTHGVPRVRCFCGNPLTSPSALKLSAESVPTGVWEGFDPSQVVTIKKSAEPVEEFTVADVAGGEDLQLPPDDGAKGDSKLFTYDDIPDSLSDDGITADEVDVAFADLPDDLRAAMQAELKLVGREPHDFPSCVAGLRDSLSFWSFSDAFEVGLWGAASSCATDEPDAIWVKIDGEWTYVGYARNGVPCDVQERVPGLELDANEIYAVLDLSSAYACFDPVKEDYRDTDENIGRIAGEPIKLPGDD